MGRFKFLKNLLYFFIFYLTFSFTVLKDSKDFGIEVEKTIKGLSENFYEVSIHLKNGNQIDGVSRYEVKLPISADFVKEIERDKSINFKISGRKIKMIWMHIQRNKSYLVRFNIKSKLKIDKLKMPGKFIGHLGDEQIHIKDISDLKLSNAE